MTAQRLVEFGIMHTATAPSGWWASGMERLAVRRRELSPRYEVFRGLFLDQEIISHDTFESWFKVWKQATQLYAAGYAAIETNAATFDRTRLDQTWERLLAAAS